MRGVHPIDTQWQVIEGVVRARINRVLKHRQFIMGPEVEEFEQRLAKLTGAAHVVSCGSGTDALLLSLMAVGVGPGQAVFTTVFSFIAAAEAIKLLGATPVFVDIDPDTFVLDPEKLDEAVRTTSQHTSLVPRAIVPVDLFGVPADYEALNVVAREHDLTVVSDAAHSLGAEYAGQTVGTLGDITAVSFFPSKPLGAYGDGGAVLTNSDSVAETVRQMRIHGRKGRGFPHVYIGLNSRLDTIQAAVLLAKLDYFKQELEHRRQCAADYQRALGGMVQLQEEPLNTRSAWAYYSVVTDARDAVQADLAARGVPTAVYYPQLLCEEPVFANLSYGVDDFPVARRLSKRIVHLPLHGHLPKSAVDAISRSVTQSIHEHTVVSTSA